MTERRMRCPESRYNVYSPCVCSEEVYEQCLQSCGAEGAELAWWHKTFEEVYDGGASQCIADGVCPIWICHTVNADW